MLVNHLAESHVKTLITRPVSSTTSLLLVVAKTARDLVRDTALDMFYFPALGSEPVAQVAHKQGMDLIAWEHELDRITGRSSNHGTVKLLIDGEKFFDRFLESVNQAQDSVIIRTYIFDTDDFALQVADVLKHRSQSIDIRVLYDGLGTINGARVSSESMPTEHKSPTNISSYLQQDSNIRSRKISNPWLTGDHTKTAIIDHHTAFLGGMNIGREYRYDWHDMMVEITGDAVSQLQQDSEEAWRYSGPLGDFSYFQHADLATNIRKPASGYPFRLLYTSPLKEEIYQTQLKAIQRSQNYIYIENAYFSDDRMLYELAKARKRGVDVRIILPSQGNHAPMNRSNILAINSLLLHGIRVFFYPGMSHVKAAIYDNWACLGTANFDKMSFMVNRELNIGSSHPALVEALRIELFEKDFSESTEILTPLPVNWNDHFYERLADVAL
ncbi:MAG: phosphatidylserine/phosphatidylglycerophosphate/cardiolipin synthase family protein [Pseudomonadales bacterium]